MQYNISILSAGRRVELVQCFQRAAKRIQEESSEFQSKIRAADLSPLAPAGFLLMYTVRFHVLVICFDFGTASA